MALMEATALAGHQDDPVYLVLDDLAMFGRAYRETDEGRADRQSIIANLLSSQYERPLKIVAFNAAEGWAADVTAEIAQEIHVRTRDHDELAPALHEFLDRALRSSSHSSIPLPLRGGSTETLPAVRLRPPARVEPAASAKR